MAGTRVSDPRGNEWEVRRRWTRRRPRWRRAREPENLIDAAELVSFGDDLPVIGGVLAIIGLVLLAVLAVVVIIPALIFIGEVLVVLAIIGLGFVGRVALGRPWTVEARQVAGPQALEWKVRGWRASRDQVRGIADEIRVSGVPTGGTTVDLGDP